MKSRPTRSSQSEEESTRTDKTRSTNHPPTDDESYFTYYDDPSMEKIRNKKLALVTYVPFDDRTAESSKATRGASRNKGPPVKRSAVSSKTSQRNNMSGGGGGAQPRPSRLGVTAPEVTGPMPHLHFGDRNRVDLSGLRDGVKPIDERDEVGGEPRDSSANDRHVSPKKHNHDPASPAGMEDEDNLNPSPRYKVTVSSRAPQVSYESGRVAYEGENTKGSDSRSMRRQRLIQMMAQQKGAAARGRTPSPSKKTTGKQASPIKVPVPAPTLAPAEGGESWQFQDRPPPVADEYGRAPPPRRGSGSGRERTNSPKKKKRSSHSRRSVSKEDTNGSEPRQQQHLQQNHPHPHPHQPHPNHHQPHPNHHQPPQPQPPRRGSRGQGYGRRGPPDYYQEPYEPRIAMPFPDNGPASPTNRSCTDGGKERYVPEKPVERHSYEQHNGPVVYEFGVPGSVPSMDPGHYDRQGPYDYMEGSSLQESSVEKPLSTVNPHLYDVNGSISSIEKPSLSDINGSITSLTSKDRERFLSERYPEYESMSNNELQMYNAYNAPVAATPKETQSGHQAHSKGPGPADVVSGGNPYFLPDPDAPIRQPRQGVNPIHQDRSQGSYYDIVVNDNGGPWRPKHGINNNNNSNNNNANLHNPQGNVPNQPVNGNVGNQQQTSGRSLSPVVEERCSSENTNETSAQFVRCSSNFNDIRFGSANAARKSCRTYTTQCTSFVTRVWSSCGGMNVYQTESKFAKFEMIADQSVSALFEKGLPNVPEAFEALGKSGIMSLSPNFMKEEENSSTRSPSLNGNGYNVQTNRDGMEEGDGSFFDQARKDVYGKLNGTSILNTLSKEFRYFTDTSMENTEVLNKAMQEDSRGQPYCPESNRSDAIRSNTSSNGPESVMDDVKNLFDQFQSYYVPEDDAVEQRTWSRDPVTGEVDEMAFAEAKYGEQHDGSVGLEDDEGLVLEGDEGDVMNSTSIYSAVVKNGNRRDMMLGLQRRRMKALQKKKDVPLAEPVAADETLKLRDIYLTLHDTIHAARISPLESSVFGNMSAQQSVRVEEDNKTEELENSTAGDGEVERTNSSSLGLNPPQEGEEGEDEEQEEEEQQEQQQQQQLNVATVDIPDQASEHGDSSQPTSLSTMTKSHGDSPEMKSSTITSSDPSEENLPMTPEDDTETPKRNLPHRDKLPPNLMRSQQLRNRRLRGAAPSVPEERAVEADEAEAEVILSKDVPSAVLNAMNDSGFLSPAQSSVSFGAETVPHSNQILHSSGRDVDTKPNVTKKTLNQTMYETEFSSDETEIRNVGSKTASAHTQSTASTIESNADQEVDVKPSMSADTLQFENAHSNDNCDYYDDGYDDDNDEEDDDDDLTSFVQQTLTADEYEDAQEAVDSRRKNKRSLEAAISLLEIAADNSVISTSGSGSSASGRLLERSSDNTDKNNVKKGNVPWLGRVRRLLVVATIASFFGAGDVYENMLTRLGVTSVVEEGGSETTDHESTRAHLSPPLVRNNSPAVFSEIFDESSLECEGCRMFVNEHLVDMFDIQHDTVEPLERNITPLVSISPMVKIDIEGIINQARIRPAVTKAVLLSEVEDFFGHVDEEIGSVGWSETLWLKELEEALLESEGKLPLDEGVKATTRPEEMTQPETERESDDDAHKNSTGHIAADTERPSSRIFEEEKRTTAIQRKQTESIALDSTQPAPKSFEGKGRATMRTNETGSTALVTIQSPKRCEGKNNIINEDKDGGKQQQKISPSTVQDASSIKETSTIRGRNIYKNNTKSDIAWLLPPAKTEPKKTIGTIPLQQQQQMNKNFEPKIHTNTTQLVKF